MPEDEASKRAQEDQLEGKAPSTQAGEFIREEMHHIREGKHGARSPQQAIAIGLSKARRSGVDLPPPARGRVSEKTRSSAKHAYEAGQDAGASHKPAPRRSRAITRALQRESTQTADSSALSDQARKAAARRNPAERSATAKKAARTRARG